MKAKNIDKKLHIVTFDVPYPPNYGGAIDVFYLLKGLKNLGTEIILHCFVYGKQKESPELEQLCKQLYYYKRKSEFWNALRTGPFIVDSRRDEKLLRNLIRMPYPILFAGMHTTFYLQHPKLKNRPKVFREINIEHEYYWHLYKAEKSFLKKAYFFLESKKLKLFEKNMRHAQAFACVSQKDTTYYQHLFPDKKVEFIPCFHANEKINSLTGTGKYFLYHGNLSVPENSQAAEFLIQNVFSKLNDYQVIIAGKNPPKALKNLSQRYSHIQFIANPEEEKMQELIRQAHIHCLYTEQATGLKLKLLNALYNGRFVIANDKMLAGTGLETACVIANSPQEFIQKINETVKIEFAETNKKQRKESLKYYDNANNASRLYQLIFGK